MSKPDDMLAGLSAAKKAELLRLAAAMEGRKCEGLRFYEPQPEQDRFHQSMATQRIAIGGYRAGKSLCVYAEGARAILGCDPYGKFRKPTPDNPFVVWIVAYNEDAIGQTAYRLLFRAGAFKMIRDKNTGTWRAYRPWEPEDLARVSETRGAPPLIPPRFVPPGCWGWDNKAQRTFKSVRFADGSVEIFAFTSGSEPRTGDPIDLAIVDEDVAKPFWITELQSRLSDRKGRLIWSSRPRLRNNALVNLHRRSIAEAKKKQENPEYKPEVEQFVLGFLDNKHLDDAEKLKRIQDWEHLPDDARNSLIYGTFSLTGSLMYPTFHKDTHGVPSSGTVETDFDKALEKRQVPSDWTRYMVMDPGYSVFGVLFCAVPPPRFGDFVVAYDELYLENCDTPKLEGYLKHACAGQRFQTFIIDDHGSRVHNALNTRTNREQISEVLRRLNIRSRTTGASFVLGSDDTEGRQNIVRAWLSVREDGTPKLRVIIPRCPKFCEEIETLRRRVKEGMILDQPALKDASHLTDCLEYLAAYGPKYHPPRVEKKLPTPIYQDFLDHKHKKKRRTPFSSGGSIHLGAGAPQPAFL